MAADDPAPFADIETTLKHAAAALREADVPFLLGGSLASWARGEVRSVLGMEMRVMALEDVLVTKLMALTEHALRYESLLPIARALREKVDWESVRARTSESPFARAFFVLLEDLDVVHLPAPAGRRETRVRVVTPTGSTEAPAG